MSAPWTEMEVATLRRLYPWTGAAQAARALRGRSVKAVQRKACAIGLRMAPVLRARRGVA